jgi:glutamate-ammonia-ligase adenylyltransferase
MPARPIPARFHLPTAWPPPADAAAAGRFIERVAAHGRTEARLARDPAAAAMLACLGGNAPYLADLALRESAALRMLAKSGPDAVVAGEMARLAAIRPTIPRADLAASLRQAKRVCALAIAVADIGGIWPLARVTEALSDLAEAALRACVAHLLRAAHDQGALRLPNPARPEAASGFVVLGMGKLGARELNYSSDIDLVLLHNPETATDCDSAGALFTRIARGLVALMDARDADGYVFRTDLRLRPDPAATPPSIAVHAAIAYYESMGQNWERAAMLKARPVAGDLALGQEFLGAIRPFIWRRHLDFAAVADIHAMKRRIDAHKKTGLGAQADPVARICGFNVKLGQGGIREIEFLAQTLQLVWGGRDPALRVARTLEALRLLVRAGHIPRRAAGELAAAYAFLRRVEHRLQMVADRQTHSLPDTPAALESFALFMGFAGAADFAATLLRHLGRVQASYARQFGAVPALPAAPARLDFAGADDPADTVSALAALGYDDPAAIIAAVRGWLAGRVRALRSHRARELMAEMLPTLLDALARHGTPDAVFRRFDAFLARLPAGVALLSLFERNPALLDRVASVLGAAPSLAEHLARTPSALEGLLAPDASPDIARELRRRLAAAPELEDAIGVIRATVRAEDFRVSVATMEGRLDVDAAGLARTAMADAALAALLPRVLADFTARNGRVRGGGLAVVLLGKGGGREMMAGSDLDLMLVYDHPPGVAESTPGVTGRRMAASQWFIRAVHAYVAALTAPDAEGPTYEVDMRLRPSGNKGPVAVSLAGFVHYHEPIAADAAEAATEPPHGAWTWERMALTRARVVAGPPALRARLREVIRAAIAGAGSPARIRADIAAMRARLARDLPPTGPWDVKLRSGGQIEVEFIAQAAQLIHPAAAHPTTRLALAALRDAGALPPVDAELLIRADRLWRTVQGMLRLTSGRKPAAVLPEASAERLLRAVEASGAVEAAAPLDVATLRATLDDTAAAVRAAFIRQVGEISP